MNKTCEECGAQLGEGAVVDVAQQHRVWHEVLHATMADVTRPTPPA